MSTMTLGLTQSTREITARTDSSQGERLKPVVLTLFAATALVFAGVAGMNSKNRTVQKVGADIVLLSPAIKGFGLSFASRRTQTGAAPS